MFPALSNNLSQAMRKALFTLLVIAPVSAGTTTVYFNDFQAPAGSLFPEWSSPGYTNTGNVAGTIAPGSGPQLVTNVDSPNGTQRFLGEFGGPDILMGAPSDPMHFVRVNESVVLTLTGLAPHSGATLDFDLQVLKSWDGNSPIFGPDRFTITVVGGPTLLDTTFSNNLKVATDGSTQNYPAPGSAPQTGATSVNTLGYTFFGNSTYHLNFSFGHTGDTLALMFASSLYEGKGTADESWGLDNVRVAIDSPAAVPEPGTLLSIATGGLLLATRKLRRRVKSR